MTSQFPAIPRSVHPMLDPFSAYLQAVCSAGSSPLRPRDAFAKSGELEHELVVFPISTCQGFQVPHWPVENYMWIRVGPNYSTFPFATQVTQCARSDNSFSFSICEVFSLFFWESFRQKCRELATFLGKMANDRHCYRESQCRILPSPFLLSLWNSPTNPV